MKSSQPFARFFPTTDQLWPLIILAGFSVFASLMPISPNDFWWHLKIGQIIFTQGQIPTANLFSWSLPAETPFFYGAWLGEYLLYVLYHWGGLALVSFARSLLIVVTYWLMGQEIQRRSGSWRLAALGIAIVSFSTINNLLVRPQIWSWLPFIIYLILLSRWADGQLDRRWLLLLPPLMMFWVNVHGAFIVGLVMIGMVGAGETLPTVYCLLPTSHSSFPKLTGGRPLKDIVWFWGVGILTALATTVNPKFVNIFGYVLDLMTDQPSQRLIEEWQSPAPLGLANSVFYASILLLLLVFAYSNYRPTISEALMVAGFLWLAWSGQRYVIWFELIAMPILAKGIVQMPISIKGLRLKPQRSWINLLLILIIFIPAVLVQPWLVENLPLNEAYWSGVWRGANIGPLVGKATPLDAVEYLQAHPGGKLFNEMGYGSYLIWAAPEQGVFIDPRVELYPYEQWQDYIRISRAARYNELLDQYGANRILLDKKLQDELAAALRADAGWQLEFEGERAELWRHAELWRKTP